nr:hypothetical protein BgiMline_021303 [Biomphalaria glabrata]
MDRGVARNRVPSRSTHAPLGGKSTTDTFVYRSFYLREVRSYLPQETRRDLSTWFKQHPWRDTDKRFGLWADLSVVKEDRSPSDAPCAPPVSRAQVRFNDVYGSLFEQCLMAENVGKEIPQRGRVDGWMNGEITLTSPRGFPTSGGPRHNTTFLHWDYLAGEKR